MSPALIPSILVRSREGQETAVAPDAWMKARGSGRLTLTRR